MTMLRNFAATEEKTDWGEQLANTIATQTIAHLFTKSQDIEVQLRCFPSTKLLQGIVDGFRMSGRGLVIRQDFRVEDMWFTTDAVELDFASLLQGRMTLKRPTQAVAQVVLVEADLNHAFTSRLVRQHLENVSDPKLTSLSGGEPVSFGNIQVKLLEEQRIHLQAEAYLPNGVFPVSFSCTLEVERRRRLRFSNPQWEQTGVSQLLSVALAEILDNMVDLDKFNLDGVSLRLNRLAIAEDKLVFSGYAEISHIPASP